MSDTIGLATVLQQNKPDLAPLWKSLTDMADAHTAFHILRKCLSVVRVNHVLRTVPPSATRKMAQEYDGNVRDVFQDIIAKTISDSTYRELQLPTRDIDEGTPTLGLGLTSAVDISPAAYLSSHSLTTTLRQAMIGQQRSKELAECFYAQQTHVLLTARSPPGSQPPLATIGTKPIRQRTLCAPIFRRVYEKLPESPERTKAFRSTLALPGAKLWIDAQPNPFS